MKADGVVSNTVTIAIAPPGAASCSDPANPISALERTTGSAGFVHVQRVGSISDITSVRVNTTLDKLYARFVKPQPALRPLSIHIFLILPRVAVWCIKRVAMRM